MHPGKGPKNKGASSRSSSSHKSAASRGIATHNSSSRNLHPRRPSSSDHSHSYQARQQFTGHDHPHYYSHGRTNGGRGTGLRHDSFASAAPDHVIPAHLSSGSAQLSSHLADSIAQNRARQFDEADSGPAADMHKATMEHYYGPKANEQETARYTEKIPTLNDFYAPPYSRTESLHARMKQEVEADYYGDLDRKQKENNLLFPEMPSMNKQSTSTASSRYNNRWVEQNDTNYLKNQSYQDKIRDDAFDEFQSPLDAGFKINRDTNETSYKTPNFTKKSGFFGGGWFGGSNDANEDQGKNYNQRFRDEPSSTDPFNRHSTPNKNDPNSQANFRATSQTYRPKTDSTENVIDWQMVEHDKPNWKDDPHGTDTKPRNWQRQQKIDETAKHVLARDLAIADTMHYQDPRHITPRGWNPNAHETPFWRSYMLSQQRRKNDGHHTAWNGNDYNRFWGRVTWARMLKNMRPAHPPTEPNPKLMPRQDMPLTDGQLQSIENQKLRQELYLQHLNRGDLASHNGAPQSEYEDKINTLRGNVDQLTKMQHQVNNLKAQFYGRGQGVATHSFHAQRPTSSSSQKNVNRVDFGNESTRNSNLLEQAHASGQSPAHMRGRYMKINPDGSIGEVQTQFSGLSESEITAAALEVDSKNRALARMRDWDGDIVEQLAQLGAAYGEESFSAILAQNDDDLALVNMAVNDAKARNDQHSSKAKVEKRAKKMKKVMKDGEEVEVTDNDDDDDQNDDNNQNTGQNDQNGPDNSTPGSPNRKQLVTQGKKKSPTKKASGKAKQGQKLTKMPKAAKSAKSAKSAKTAKSTKTSKTSVLTNTTTPTDDLSDRALESVTARQYSQGRDVIVPKAAKKSLGKNKKLKKMIQKHRTPISTQEAIGVLIETRQEMDKMLHALEDHLDNAMDRGAQEGLDKDELRTIGLKLETIQTLLDRSLSVTQNRIAETQVQHHRDIVTEHVRQEVWKRQVELRRQQEEEEKLKNTNETETSNNASPSILGLIRGSNQRQRRVLGQDGAEEDDELNVGEFLHPEQNVPNAQNDLNHDEQLQARVLFHHFDADNDHVDHADLGLDQVDVVPLFQNQNFHDQQNEQNEQNSEVVSTTLDLDFFNPALAAQHQAELANIDPLAMPDQSVPREVLQQQYTQRQLQRQRAPSPSLGGVSGVMGSQLRFGGVLAPSPALNPLQSTPRRQFSSYANESPSGTPNTPPQRQNRAPTHIDLNVGRSQFTQSPSISGFKSQELAQQRKTKESMTPTMGAANKHISELVNPKRDRDDFANSFSLDSDIYHPDVMQLIRREEHQYENEQRMSSSRAAKADVINSMKRGSSIPRSGHSVPSGDNAALNFVPKGLQMQQKQAPLPKSKPTPSKSSAPSAQFIQPPQVIQVSGGGLKHTPQFQQQFAAGLNKGPTQINQQFNPSSQPSKPKQATLPGTPVSVGTKRRYSTSSRVMGEEESGTHSPGDLSGLAALSFDLDTTTSAAITINSIMGVSPSPTQSPVDLEHQLALGQMAMPTAGPVPPTPGFATYQIGDRGVSFAQMGDGRGSETNLIEQQKQINQFIDTNVVNSIRFTHQPGRPNQISATNDVVLRSGDTML